MEDAGNSFAASDKAMLEHFVDQLIDEKGINMTEILMNLPDYLLDKINAAYDENTASEELIEGIVRESGIDTETITKNALINFRESFLA